MPEFNAKSNTHLSLLFYGGYIKIDVVEPMLDKEGNIMFVKSGDNKGVMRTKKVEKQFYIKGMGVEPLKSWKTKKKGEYQTNKQVLLSIAGENDED